MPKADTVPEPHNASSKFVGPTVPTGKDEFKKHNFPDTFEHPPFIAMSPVIEMSANGKPVKDRKGDIKWKQEIQEKGQANHQWVKAQRLTKQSTPSNWFDKLLPEKRKLMVDGNYCQLVFLHKYLCIIGECWHPWTYLS